jgi:conjugal transfer pilus assembly protein TrbC
MKRHWFGLSFGLLMNTILYAYNVSVFVSFSMPDNLLEETLKESAQLNIPAYLNGLYRDSMRETALKVMALSEHIPNLNFNIDPSLFERFGIEQVPALVIDNGRAFDVIYGHLPIKEGLSRMAGRGNSELSNESVRRLE